MLHIKPFVFNMFAENTYLVWDDKNNEAIVVDPGMINQEEQDLFSTFLKENNLELTKIVNTHMHLDHSFGIDYIKSVYNVLLFAGAKDEPLASKAHLQGARFGLQLPKNPITIDVKLSEGDSVQVGTETISIIEIPGHSQGSIALYSQSCKWVMVGDALFQGSIGRTDLEGGNYAQLISSIQNKLLVLEEDTIVLPGHGGTTTIGDEKVYNPYL